MEYINEAQSFSVNYCLQCLVDQDRMNALKQKNHMHGIATNSERNCFRWCD
jgi:hypothetical protein